MNGDIGVISTFCNPWPKDYPKRYYVKFWEDRFEERIFAYYRKNNIDLADKKSQIHIFFDNYGTLHITQCHDQKLCYDLQCYVENLYKWELENNSSIVRCSYNVSIMLIPFISSLNHGFKQIRYRDIVINISPEQYGLIETMSVECYRTPTSIIPINVDTEIPRLNDLLHLMIKNGDIFPTQGCIGKLW